MENKRIVMKMHMLAAPRTRSSFEMVPTWALVVVVGLVASACGDYRDFDSNDGKARAAGEAEAGILVESLDEEGPTPSFEYHADSNTTLAVMDVGNEGSATLEFTVPARAWVGAAVVDGSGTLLLGSTTGDSTLEAEVGAGTHTLHLLGGAGGQLALGIRPFADTPDLGDEFGQAREPLVVGRVLNWVLARLGNRLTCESLKSTLQQEGFFCPWSMNSLPWCVALYAGTCAQGAGG